MGLFKTFLQEQQEISEIADLGLQFIFTVIQENYELTEKELDESEILENYETVLDVIVNHFIENYNPTLLESTEINSNDELFLEIENVLLDEAIGSMVASLVHGPGGERRAYQKAKLKPAMLRAKQLADPRITSITPGASGASPTVKPLYHEKIRQHREKILTGGYGTGIKKYIKTKAAERGIRSAQKRYEKSESEIRQAKGQIGVAGERLRSKEAKAARLEYKVNRALRPTNIARKVIGGVAKGVGWTFKKLIGKPKYHYYRYDYHRRYH